MPSDLGCSDAGSINDGAAPEPGAEPIMSLLETKAARPPLPDGSGSSEATSWLAAWLVPLA
jgi:hypothetical protein